MQVSCVTYSGTSIKEGASFIKIGTHAPHSSPPSRLEEAVRECQKTANVDLQKLITNSESCAQCLQHLVAMETNPTRVVSAVFSALAVQICRPAVQV